MDVFLILMAICFIWLYLNGLLTERMACSQNANEESHKAKAREIEQHSVTVEVD